MCTELIKNKIVNSIFGSKSLQACCIVVTKSYQAVAILFCVGQKKKDTQKLFLKCRTKIKKLKKVFL